MRDPLAPYEVPLAPGVPSPLAMERSLVTAFGGLRYVAHADSVTSVEGWTANTRLRTEIIDGNSVIQSVAGRGSDRVGALLGLWNLLTSGNDILLSVRRDHSEVWSWNGDTFVRKEVR